MSIEISDALKGGFNRFASRNGAVLVLAYLLVYAVYMVGYLGLMQALGSRFGVSEMSLGVPLELPLAAAAAVVLASMLAMSYLSVVAIRTFVPGARSGFPDGALSWNVPFAVGNMIAGGIALLVVIGVLIGAPILVATVAGLDGGAALLVGGLGMLVGFVATVYLSVALAFMPMYVAAEGDSFVAGFRKSWGLTRGNRLSVFLLYLVLVVLAVGVSIPVNIVSTVVAFATGGFLLSQFFSIVLIAPLAMFQLAVLAVAFQQLGGGQSATEGGGAASGAPSSAV